MSPVPSFATRDRPRRGSSRARSAAMRRFISSVFMSMVGNKVGKIEQQGDLFGISSKDPLLLAVVSSAPYRSKAEAMNAIGRHLRGRCQNGGVATF